MNDKLCPNCPNCPNLSLFILYLPITILLSVGTKVGQLGTKLGQMGQKGQGQKKICLGKRCFYSLNGVIV